MSRWKYLVIQVGFVSILLCPLFRSNILGQHIAFFPEMNISQTANLHFAFLGIPLEHINETQIILQLGEDINQFSYPNTLVWNLNFSFIFHSFPQEVMNSLRSNAYHSEGLIYYNMTLLDDLLSNSHDVPIPDCGYLFVFMNIPDNTTNHSWFYVQDREDLFLNRTDYFSGVPFRYWVFPPNFGGMHRSLYFDLSEMMRAEPTQNSTTDAVIELAQNCMTEVFPNLLGAYDSRMIAADTQKYQNYTVKILWFNGTGEQFFPEMISQSFQNLMPWTNWKIEVETRIIDAELNDLILTRTQDLPQPLNYSFVLPNGTMFSILARHNVVVDLYADSGEYDPLIRFFFDHVEDYFKLADIEDKSTIPVVFLQLNNDTAFGGAQQRGVSWFPKNVIVVGFQGSWAIDTGESGSWFLTHILRHEIGHWLSLSHHSASFETNPKIVCSMRSVTNDFCCFCKDARARMSYISYYKAITEILSQNSTSGEDIEGELNNTLQLFYCWKYNEAVEAIADIYFTLDTLPPNILSVSQAPIRGMVMPEDKVRINATVTDNLSGVKDVFIDYIANNDTWIANKMIYLGGNTWNFTIPAFPLGTNVTFVIKARDNFNNMITTEEMHMECCYQVIPEYSTQIPFILLVTVTWIVAILSYRKKKQAI